MATEAPVQEYSSAFLIAITLGFICLLYYTYQHLQSWNRVTPPGPVGLPFFGSFLSLIFTLKQQHEVINEWCHQYGRVITFRLINTQIYVISDVKLVQEVYQNPDINDRMSFAAHREIMGRENCGIATSNGLLWKEQRRFFMTVFKKVDISVIRFEEIIGTQAERLTSEIEKFKGRSFDPTDIIKLSAANIITRIITGINYDYDDHEFDKFIKCTTRVLHLLGPAGLFAFVPILSTVPSPRKNEIISLVKEIVHVIRSWIEIHRADFKPGEPAGDFISCYLKVMTDMSSESNQGTFDDVNLLASSIDALVPGWETNATTMSWILFLMAAHPDAQERVRKEIAEVVGDGRLAKHSDRHQMPVTMATIAECMRIRPASAFNLPHIVTRDCKIDNYDVPKGSVVMTNQWYTNRSPNVWDEPEELRPDRFLDQDGKFNRSLEPYPFGSGPRVCPGEQLARMEVFLFTTHIFQKFKLTLPDGAPRINLGKHGITNRPDPYKIHAVEIQ